MVLASQFAPIRGIWAGFCASTGSADRSAIDQCAIPIDLVGCLKFCEQAFKDVLPNARFVPLPKMTPAGLSTGKIAGSWKPPPRNASPKDEKNTGENPARITRFSPCELHKAILLWLWDICFQAFPEIVRQNGSGHKEVLLMESSSDTS
jgi:hypothetical protein